MAVCAAALSGTRLPAKADNFDRRIDFARDVRPILADKCFQCHGPDSHERKAGLRLDSEESAKSSRKGRPAISPNQPEGSDLIRRITAPDAMDRMPPPDSGKNLSASEIETLRRWIAEGAIWSGHWAYEIPVPTALPVVRNTAWPYNWVDTLVLSPMERAGLEPSADADRVTLIRRLSFDLTGLPPTPAAVAEFLQDNSPDAYEKLVDRLLASVAYGERMAMYWLDLVRYADTVGYHGDQEHHISPYRDWVIDALNANMPFDQFTREQLAGDLVPESTIDQKIASGYNRLLQTSHEGGVQAKEYLAIYAADRVRNISAVWMGATLGCAQCHDHKFDPFTSKDFYAMAAFFADIDEADHLRKGADQSPTVRKPEIPVLSREDRNDLDRVDAERAALRIRLETSGDSLGEADRQKIAVQLVELDKRREAITKRERLTMISVPIEPRIVRLLPRGNWLDDSGPIVEPAVPEFMGRIGGDRRANRLDLANWLTNGNDGIGPLTARVMVNRLWYLLFGRGLSRSLDDFGAQGEPPTHLQLLDRLAHDFVASGWDLKHMMRMLVTSHTYRQSSVATERLRQSDPDNRLWARQAQWRLPAESMRDTVLAASGLLEWQLGGPSARPYQPDGYYKHLNFPPRTYTADTGPGQWRRGLYVHWQRQYLHPMLKAFDAPSREECTAERSRSRTPLASLALLNDPTFVEAARVLAARLLLGPDSTDTERIKSAFLMTVSRSPDSFETRVLTELLEASRKQFATNPGSASKLLMTGLAPVPENCDPKELASWTMVVRAVLNMSETYLRN